MKKIILIIVLFFNLIPVLKEGKIKIMGAFEALANEGYGNEDGEDHVNPDPCDGLANSYNSSFHPDGSRIEQNGYLASDANGNRVFIDLNNSGNTSTSSVFPSAQINTSTGDVYVTINGEMYQIHSVVHSHPNSGTDPSTGLEWEIGPSPSDMAQIAEMNSYGGSVNGVIMGADGFAHSFGASGITHSQDLSDYFYDQCL